MNNSGGGVIKKISLAKSIYSKGKQVDSIDEYFNAIREQSEKEAEEAADLLREAKNKYDKAYKSWCDSHNYRLKIIEYADVLNSWRDELEAREKELNDKAEKMLDDVEKQSKENHAARMKELQEKELLLKQEREDLIKLHTDLERAELRTLHYLTSADKKEISLYKRMEKEFDECKKYERKREIDRADIYKDMDGFKYEQHIASIMRLNGFTNVEVTKKSGDYGSDILAEHAGAKYVVQCKYYSHPVGIAAIQEVIAAKSYYHANVCVVATSNIFTRQAVTLANESNVILWDCKKIDEMEAVLFGG